MSKGFSGIDITNQDFTRPRRPGAKSDAFFQILADGSIADLEGAIGVQDHPAPVVVGGETGQHIR